MRCAPQQNRDALGSDTVPFETKMTSAASIRTVGLLLAGGVNRGVAAERYSLDRDIRLLLQRKPNGLLGGLATAYGFVIQKGDQLPLAIRSTSQRQSSSSSAASAG